MGATMSTQRLMVFDTELFSRDEKGWAALPIANPFGDFKEPIGGEVYTDVHYLHMVSINPGEQRGNHYHEHQIEYLVVLNGIVEVKWRLLEEQVPKVQLVDAEKPKTLRVEPMTIHSLKNVGDIPTIIMCFSSNEQLSKGDTVKVPGFHDGD
jgi:dTDP-4-dehydrorhamnose 3,5-epimerase-like enzyme